MSSTFDDGRANSASLAPAMANWLREQSAFQNAVSVVKTWRHRAHSFHDVYDLDYFETLERTSARKVQIIAQSIVEHLNPVRVVDLGCGTGNLIENLRTLGVKTVGADLSEIALAYCEKRGLDVKKIDFTDPNAIRCPIGRFDVALSLDVAHQLPRTSALSHVAYLCHHADTVVFTAPHCASGRLPKCVKPAEFWAEQFDKHDFALDYTLSAIFKAEWTEGANVTARRRQPLVFQRNGW